KSSPTPGRGDEPAQPLSSLDRHRASLDRHRGRRRGPPGRAERGEAARTSLRRRDPHAFAAITKLAPQLTEEVFYVLATQTQHRFWSRSMGRGVMLEQTDPGSPE